TRQVDIHRLTRSEDLLNLGLHRKADQWLCFDLETRADRNNLEDWHPSSRIVSLSLSWGPDVSFVIPLSHPAASWKDWREQARYIAREVLARFPLVGHNVKFDARWIHALTGIDLSANLAWDTMVASHIMDELQSHSLKQRAVEDLGVDPWADVDLTDAEKADWMGLSRYNALDTAHTFQLMQWQQERLREDPPRARLLWFAALPCLRALTRMEQNGLLLDQDEVKRRTAAAEVDRDRLYSEFEAQVPAELSVQFQERFGYGGQRLFDVGPPTKKERLSLAPTSAFFKAYAERAWPVLETTSKGAPCWDASVLKRLSSKGFADATLLQQYRKVDKQLSTYLHPWPEDVAEDGRLHGTFKMTATNTGRLSCERPNLQQVDRTLKTCFRAPDGWRFVQADYSQIEVRLAAMLSGDENLQQVYRDGRDVYVETAAAVNHVAADDVSKELRQQAKPIVLGFLYGMQARSFVDYARDSYGIDFTEEGSEEARDAFFRLYPGLLTYHERMRREVRQHDKVTSPFGMVRHLPEIKARDRGLQWAAERQAINAPIQSAAATLMQLALAAINEEPKLAQTCRIVGSVHDSGLLEVPDYCWREVLEVAGPLMVSPPGLAHFDVELPVPLVVEFEVGDRWGHAGETAVYSSSGLPG
ncbi:MAG: DNA polymerase, partial [Dehalococcoidia bacterium]